MEDLYLILTISGIHFLALMSPGPDFIMVVKNSVQYSRKIGIFTSIGISLGIIIHLFYCLTGISFIISTNDTILIIFKFFCSGYLLFLGVKSIRDSNLNQKSIYKKATGINIYEAIRIGFLTNVLNPKVSLFFLSLFSLVILPEDLPINLLITLIIIIVNSTFIWFSLVSIVINQSRINLLLLKNLKYLNRIFGFLLIFISLKLLNEIVF